MRNRRMESCATRDVRGLTPGLGVLTSVGWKPARMGHLHRTEHVEQPTDQRATIQALEQELAALIARAAQGNQTALAAFYDETSSLVYSLALRILRDQFAAEDVTVDVYTQVYRQASSYDASRGTPSAWLLTLIGTTARPRSRTTSRVAGNSHRGGSRNPLGNGAATNGGPARKTPGAHLQALVVGFLPVHAPEGPVSPPLKGFFVKKWTYTR